MQYMGRYVRPLCHCQTVSLAHLLIPFTLAVDTRAAHLDRSRAKGAIQRLSMRIHYQRAALSKTGGQLRLGHFFSPGCISRQPKRRNVNWS